MAALAPSVADKEKFPFQTKLSTKTGADGQLKLEVSDFGEPKSRKPKPDFENKGQLIIGKHARLAGKNEHTTAKGYQYA
mgnify:CR=1 FL=1